MIFAETILFFIIELRPSFKIAEEKSCLSFPKIQHNRFIGSLHPEIWFYRFFQTSATKKFFTHEPRPGTVKTVS